MKTIISILMILFSKDNSMFENPKALKTCSECISTFCMCDLKCSEGQFENCTCGMFTCLCHCETEGKADSSSLSTPAMNVDQEMNSIKAEAYFKSFQSPEGDILGDAMKGLREAIKSKDLKKYQFFGNRLEATFSILTPSQKDAWEVWSLQNLK